MTQTTTSSQYATNFSNPSAKIYESLFLSARNNRKIFLDCPYTKCLEKFCVRPNFLLLVVHWLLWLICTLLSKRYESEKRRFIRQTTVFPERAAAMRKCCWVVRSTRMCAYGSLLSIYALYHKHVSVSNVSSHPSRPVRTRLYPHVSAPGVLRSIG